MSQNPEINPQDSDIPASASNRTADDLNTLEFHPRLNLGPRYNIVKLLGVGGMGIVYKARDKELNIDVAIKVIKPEFLSEPMAVERFKNELLLARQVSHKNVVRIYDLGDLGGTKYISMAYIEGRTLREVLSESAPLPVPQVVSIIRQLCEALRAAHEVGVVHRDLKPENIILDAEGNAFIMDFGIALSTQATQAMTRTGSVVGSFEYISPEQLKGEKVTQRADLFSLGIIAYEMLTGKLAHQSESLPEFITNRLQQKLQDPKQLNPAIPNYLITILHKCLEVDTNLRYQDALEIIHDLETEQPRLSFTSQFKRKVQFVKRDLALAVMAIALVLSASLLYKKIYFKDQRGKQSPSTEIEAVAKSSVVVLPFINGTNDTSYDWVKTGLSELLTTNLAQSKYIRLIGTQRLSQLLKDLRISSNDPVDHKILQQIVSFLNCDTILTGTVAKAGENIRIQVKLQKAKADQIFEISSLTMDGREGTLFNMIDSLSGQVRVKLDIPIDSIKGDIKTHEVVHTKSLGAYKNFSLGLEALRQENYRQAVLSLERAIEEDPDLVPAYAKLSEAYLAWGYEEKAAEYYKKSIAKLDKASFLDSRLIQAGHALLNNNIDEAIKMYQEIVRVHPHNEEVRFSTGAAYEKKGDLKNALAQYEKVISIEPNHAKANLAVGRSHILLRNPKDALNYLIKALALYTQLNHEQGRADSLNALGVAYEHLQRFDEAVRNYQESIDIKRKLGDKRGIAASLQNIARIHRTEGKYEIAQQMMKQSLQLYKEVGNKEGIINALNGLGVAYQQMGKYDEALDHYKEALKITKTLANLNLLALSYENVAHVYYLLGNYEDAYVFHKQALQEQTQLKDTDGMIRSLQKLGDVELEQGRFQNALNNHLQALEMARKISYKEAVGVSLVQLGLVYSALGRYRAALESYDEALKVSEEIKGKALKTEIMRQLGAINLELGDGGRARENLQEALKMAREIGDEEVIAQILCSISQLDLMTKNPDAAKEHSELALHSAHKSKSKKAILMVQAHSTLVAIETGDIAKASAMATSGAQASERMGHAELMTNYSYMKMAAYFKMKKYDQALALSEKAKKSAEAFGLRGYLLKILSLKGKAQWALGKRKEALASYVEAARVLDNILTEIGAEHKKSFLQRADVQSTYADTVKLAALLDKSDIVQLYEARAR